LVYDEKAFQKRLIDASQAGHLLSEFLKILQVIDDFAAANLKAALEEFCQRFEIKIGDIIHALRVAATGRAVGFGVFETLEVLGRDESLARIRRCLQRLPHLRDAQTV
jgi:glutamyl-tRNA synthetase